MSSRTFQRIAKSAAIVAVGAQLNFSALGADPLPSDGQDMARRLIQPVPTFATAASGEAQTVRDAHNQAAALIQTGSVKGYQTMAGSAPAASVAPVDPHQATCEHLRWTPSGI
jgi:hypothetical protein